MGSVSMPIAQGPRRHCGNLEPHELHPNHVPVEGAATIPQEVRADGTWCDGILPLKPFLDLSIRVPLVGEMSMDPATHEEALDIVLEELPSFTWDQMFPPGPTATSTLRLRWGGEDRVYPIRYENGQWVTSHDAGD